MALEQGDSIMSPINCDAVLFQSHAGTLIYKPYMHVEASRPACSFLQIVSGLFPVA